MLQDRNTHLSRVSSSLPSRCPLRLYHRMVPGSGPLSRLSPRSQQHSHSCETSDREIPRTSRGHDINDHDGPCLRRLDCCLPTLPHPRTRRSGPVPSFKPRLHSRKSDPPLQCRICLRQIPWPETDQPSEPVRTCARRGLLFASSFFRLPLRRRIREPRIFARDRSPTCRILSPDEAFSLC